MTKPALSRADGEEQIDHADDRPVLPQDENAAAIGLLENQTQPAQLLGLIRPEIAFFAEKLAEQNGQFVQVFKSCRLDDDFAHLWLRLFHKGRAVAMRIWPPPGLTKTVRPLR